MISDILKQIFVERLSLNEIAQKMGMSGEQLKDRLRTMEQMGYLAKADPNIFRCSSCSSCTASMTCDPDSGQYMLTEKGARLIKI